MTVVAYQMSFLAFRLHKINFGRALPRTLMESLQCSIRPSSRLRRGYPVLIPYHLEAFGVSLATPLALNLGSFGTEVSQLLNRSFMPLPGNRADFIVIAAAAHICPARLYWPEWKAVVYCRQTLVVRQTLLLMEFMS